MAIAYVPVIPPFPNLDSVRNGKAPSAQVWRNALHLSNYATHFSDQLVPWCFPNVVCTAGSTHRFEFEAHATGRHRRSRWYVIAETTTAGATATVLIDAAESLADVTIGVASNADYGGIAEVVCEHPVGRSTNPSPWVEVTPAGNDVRIVAIANVSEPMTIVPQVGSRVGASPDWARPGQPVIGDGTTSLGQLANFHQTHNLNMLWRAGLWAWSVPTTVGGVESTAFAPGTTAGSGAPDTLVSLGVPALGQIDQLDNATAKGETTHQCRLWALCKNSDGATAGRVTIAMTSGDSATISSGTSDSTWTWRSALIDIDSEDYDQSDGRRGGAWDEATIQFYRQSGSGTFYVGALCLTEA